MSCCRESNEASNENIPFPITPESKQWLIMMKYMLNCAETSLEFLDHVKTDLEFNNDDLERFSLLCFALEQARHQMALLGKNFFNDSSTTNLLDDDFSMLSALNDTKNIKEVNSFKLVNKLHNLIILNMLMRKWNQPKKMPVYVMYSQNV